MNKKELLKLIEGGEAQGLEFTEDAEDVGKSVCSLVNTNNGAILVGVSDDKEIIGCTKKDEQKIANIAHTCKPSIYPKVDKVEVNGNRDYQRLCRTVSRKTLVRDLQELVGTDILERRGEKKGVYYVFR